VLRGENRVTLEERNDSVKQVAPPSNDEHERSIAPTVPLDVPATKTLSDQFQDLSTIAVLAHVNLRNELKPESTTCVALHRDGEASFSINVTRDVAIQPFLLIFRTRHVVTTVNVRFGRHDE
jgi:hypothetical protein